MKRHNHNIMNNVSYLISAITDRCYLVLPLPLCLTELLLVLRCRDAISFLLDSAALGVEGLLCRTNGVTSMESCSCFELILYPIRSIRYEVAPPNTKTVKIMEADVMAFNSGLRRVPWPVIVSNRGMCSTKAKDIAPRRPAKTRTICILLSTWTFSLLSTRGMHNGLLFRELTIRLTILERWLSIGIIMTRPMTVANIEMIVRYLFQWYRELKRKRPR